MQPLSCLDPPLIFLSIRLLGIAPLMSQRIHDYFVALGFSEEEAWKTHVSTSTLDVRMSRV